MQNILIVEDEVDLTFIYVHLFDIYKYNVKIVSSGKDLDAVIADFRPAVIMLAINLLHGDGRDICRKLKQTHASIPIIMVSTMMNLKEQAISCGADDFIEKPFDLDYLINKVRYWAGKFTGLSKTGSTASSRQNEAGSMPSLSILSSE